MIGIANTVGHEYVDYGEDENQTPRGYGVFNTNAKKGSLPQKEDKLPLLPKRSCRNCYKSDHNVIKHGSAKEKKGSQATDDQIYECISQHPLSRDYEELSYNCFSWAEEAVKACGLVCP